MPAPVVVDRGRLAVDELARLPDLAAEDRDDRLVAEADAEHRHRARRRRATAASEIAGLLGPAGPGRDHEVGRARARAASSIPISSFRRTTHLRPELGEQVRQVVGERVVVVDQEQLHGYARLGRGRSRASSAASLRRHSSCSARGSLSATMPAPAWRWATPSCEHDRADRDAGVERRRRGARRAPRRA